jgi:hypothetical protein
MRSILTGLAVLALSVVLFSGAEGQEKKEGKEVTVKGTITCGKCDLGVTKACATVIVAKENGKDVTIYFDAASHKKYHGDTCTEAKKGSVTGVVSEADGKKTITVSKDGVKYD